MSDTRRSSRFPESLGKEVSLGKSNSVCTLNLSAALLHLFSATAMIIITLSLDNYQSINIPSTATYLKWNKIDDTNATSCGPDNDRRLNTSDGNFCIDMTTEPTGWSINLAWLIISFHLLSFLFQGIAEVTRYTPIFNYEYSDMVANGKNPLRFLEYSISASIMLVAIALLNGIRDLDLIFAIAVLTAGTQLCGLVVEYLTEVWLKVLLHATGWLQFVCAYGIIVHSFALSATSDSEVQPPWFVWVIVIVLFLLYASFGFVQLVEVCDNGTNRCCSDVTKENAYIVLSIVAKTLLGWMIFANVLITNRNSV